MPWVTCSPGMRKLRNPMEEEESGRRCLPRVSSWMRQTPFHPERCRRLLLTAMSRLPHVEHQRQKAMECRRREVADALRNGQITTAMMKVEALMVDEAFVEGLKLLREVANVFASRIMHVAVFKQCPTDMRETVNTLTFAALVCQSYVGEFEGFLVEMERKYGKMFVAKIKAEVPGLPINKDVRDRLGMDINAVPHGIRYARLEEIASETGIRLHESAQMGWRSFLS
ncbi:hypothetical protein CBR_g10832 [Chara braunii]|uniref:IST1-like protein n=1 Tax=Chara braunii TaxID=69332 RepID=A0A388KPC0_CHABU|nr:hypothetical protein CBR_g10832 [Chara braunii]|eukprot:GBG71896.1 hypothetical protein CBR_g10832 [Chara braunii]